MGTGRSRVEHQNVAPTARGVPAIDYDVMCVLGVAERGDAGAQVVTSWDDYKEKYGGFLLNYPMALQVYEFFRGGGQKAIVSRIMHWDVTGAPASAVKAAYTAQTAVGSPTYGTVTGTVAAPFALAHGDTILAAIDGVAAGPGTTATFIAVAATITNGIDGPWTLVHGSTIQFAIDGGATQVVTFDVSQFVDINNATAAEVAAVLNGQLSGCWAVAVGNKVKVTSDVLGTDSHVNLVESGVGPYGSDANGVLTFPVATADGSGDCADSSQVSLAEVKTWIEGDIVAGLTVSSSGAFLTIRTNTGGVAGSIQIEAASTADAKMGLDNALHAGLAGGAQNTLAIEALYYGTYGNSLSYNIQAATSGVAAEFNLLVYDAGTLVETHRNLTMDDTADRFAEKVVNLLSSRSSYIRVTDQDAPGTATDQRPNNTVAAQALAGGDDGLTSLATADYTGSAALQTGLHSFSTQRLGDALICPDDTSTTMQNAATAYCEDTKMGKMTFVPEAPYGSDSTAAGAHAQALTASESRTAVQWPWVKTANPDKAVYGSADTVELSPTGMFCGRKRRNSKEDEKKQMWVQPGNEIYGLLNNAVGLETEEVLEPTVQDTVTDLGVNPVVAGIRWTDNNYGVWVNDVQAGKRSGNFKSVGEIFGVAHLRKKFEGFLETRRTQGNTETERRAVQRAFEAELLIWTQNEVFETTDARTAFYVNADVKGVNLNNALVRENEEFKVLVAIATGRAMRFMKIMITRDQRAVESYIQQQMAAASIS